jgi:hypothetical protein
MNAPRESILTTITPAERIPSHGRQLTVDGTPGPGRPEPVTWAERHGFDDVVRRPEPLNLWDTSPESIPETWSL